MLAIVLQEDHTTYVTPVFAVKAKGWGSEAIVFDESGKNIKKISIWRPRRQLFIVEWTDFPCKRGSWAGYAKIVNDKTLMTSLCFGKCVPIGEDERFSGFSVGNSLPEWFDIENDSDIESLMEVSFDFHDSELMSCDRRDDLLEIRFDTTWGCLITVRFEGVQTEQGIDCLGMILDSKLQFEDKMLCWEVTDGASGSVGGVVDWETPFEGACIVCKKLFWKIEIDVSEED